MGKLATSTDTVPDWADWRVSLSDWFFVSLVSLAGLLVVGSCMFVVLYTAYRRWYMKERARDKNVKREGFHALVTLT